MKKAALLASLILLAGCATNGDAPSPDVCAPWRAIYVARDDVLTAETSRALLTHNRTGVRLGCWGGGPARGDTDGR